MKTKNLQIFQFVFLLTFLFSCTKAPVEELVNEEEESPFLNLSISAVIPHIFIDIDDAIDMIGKESYLNANINIQGSGKYDNLGTNNIVRTRIKGRGNSTWQYPKKPYRLKLDDKTSVLGLPAAKDWVLLANYNDYTYMTNAIGMKIAKQLGMPYTNDIIPVDLTINGEYRGSYNLTQQIEVKKDRVDVGDDGILWELDKYFDEEPWQFRSKHLNLPVMLKDPDMKSQTQFEEHVSTFQKFENMLFANNYPNNDYGSVFDKKQFVNYLIVSNLTGNGEINHPGSVYIHKKVDGKYTMGPVWDFDYGFGFNEENRIYFDYVNLPLIKENDRRMGALLIKQILKDPEVRKLYKESWQLYKDTYFEELLQFIEIYASTIRNSQKRDMEIWGNGPARKEWVNGVQDDLGKTKASMKTWLRQRVKHIDGELAKL